MWYLKTDGNFFVRFKSVKSENSVNVFSILKRWPRLIIESV